MESLVGGSRQTYTATLPLNRYHCVLDELPLHLVPQSSRRLLQESADRTLFLNPACTFLPALDLPEEFTTRRELLSGVALQGTIAWVRQPGGALLPFWLSSELEGVVQSLRPNEPAPGTISPTTRALLTAAGILV
ncbi:MAG TPA: hypothetical protein VJQ54_24780, partial [Candidatus Sulfotelmatobacter sp.]|nr:hypothetical protein [Candidatus Sulfotelmatobacter sp.]